MKSIDCYQQTRHNKTRCRRTPASESTEQPWKEAISFNGQGELSLQEYPAVESSETGDRGACRYAGYPVAVAVAKDGRVIRAANSQHADCRAYFVIGFILLADSARDRTKATFHEVHHALVVARRDRRARCGWRRVGKLVDAQAAVGAHGDFRTIQHEQLRA